jgi:hypothetical protein
LLTRSVFPSKSAEEMFKAVTAEVTFSDYKEVDGAKVPAKVVIKRDGKPFVEGEMKNLKTVTKFDDSTFAKP